MKTLCSAVQSSLSWHGCCASLGCQLGFIPTARVSVVADSEPSRNQDGSEVAEDDRKGNDAASRRAMDTQEALRVVSKHYDKRKVLVHLTQWLLQSQNLWNVTYERSKIMPYNPNSTRSDALLVVLRILLGIASQ